MSRIQKLVFAGVLLTSFALMGASVQAKQDPIKPDDQFILGTPLSVVDKKHLLEDKFVVAKTVAAMPLPVQKKILGTDTRSGMADAGQPYEISDMVGPKPLPFRRLVFVGTSPGYCVVYDEYGGVGTGQEVSLYRLSPGRAVLVWQANLRDQSRYLTLAQLQSAVAASKLYRNAK